MNNVLTEQQNILTTDILPDWETYKQNIQEAIAAQEELENKLNNSPNLTDVDVSEEQKILDEKVQVLLDAQDKLVSSIKAIGGENDPALQDLITKIKEIPIDISSVENTTAELQAMFEELKNEGSQDFAAIQEKIEQIRGTLESYNNTVGEANNKTVGLAEKIRAMSNQELVQGIISLVGAFSSLYFSINSISNIGSIISDDSLSSGEKATKIISALLIGLPMLITAIKTLATNETIASIATALWTSATAALEAGTISLTGAIAALDAAIGSIPIIGQVLIALTVIITSIVAAVKGYQQHLENVAETSKEAVERKKELVAASKEEKDKIDELAESYTKYTDLLKQNGKLTEEEQDGVYELVKAYGDQDLIIQALAGDYDKLQESIKKVRQEEDKEYQARLTSSKNAQEQSLKDTIIANASSSERDEAGYDFKGYSSEFAQQLKEQFNVDLDSFGHLDYDELNTLLTSDSTKLYNFLDAYESDSKKTVTQIRKLLSENQEAINELKTTKNSLDEASLTVIGDDLSDKIKDIGNIDDYDKVIEEMTKKAAEIYKNQGLSDTEARDQGHTWAQNFVEGFGEQFTQYTQSDVIAESFLNSILPEDISNDERANIGNQLREQLVGLTEAQRSYIAGNEAIFKAMFDNGKNVKEIFDVLSNDLNTLTNQDHVAEIQAVFDESSAKKVQEKLQELLADETIEVPFTLEQFNSMDADEQQMALLNLQQQELDVITSQTEQELEQNRIQKENLELAKEQLETEIGQVQRIKERVDAQTELNIISLNQGVEGGSKAWGNDDLHSIYSEMFGGDAEDEELFTQKYNDTMLKIADLYDECLANGENFSTAIQDQWDELADEDVQKYIDKLVEIQDLNDNGTLDGSVNKEALAKQWSDATQSSRKYEKQLKSLEDTLSKYNAELEDIEKKDPANVDWVQQFENTKNVIDEVNDAIDDLQTAYQTLQGVVEDYNDDGKLTLDNLQSLMEMSDEYVASLELQNGTLTLNEEKISDATQVKYEYLKSLAAEMLYTQLQAIVNGEVLTSDANLAEANVKLANTFGEVSDAAVRSKDELLELKAVQDAMAEDSEATNTAIDAYYNRIAMIENLASQTTQEQLEKKSSSSSSSSSNDPDEKDTLKIGDIDLYRGINEELEKIETTLSRIQTIDEHSWGASSLAALKTESKLLQDQIDKYEEKAELQEGDLSKQKASLESQGIEFSSDGSTMTNASEKLKTLYEEYNAMVNTYNAMSKEEQEEYKDTVEKKKEAIDNLEDAIDDYETLYSEYQDTIDNILDKQYEQIENNVKRFNYDVEIHLELSEARKEWNDFWYDVVKDVNDDTDFGGRIADSLANLSSQVEKNLANLKELVGLGTKSIDESTVGKLVKHVKDTTEEVSKQIASAATGGDASIFKNDSALSKETLTNYRDQLISALTEAKEAVDDIADSYLSIYDKAEEKIENQRAALDSVGKQINHNIKLLNLRKFDLSDSKRNAALDKQYQQQYDNNMKVIGSNKLYVNNLKKQLEEEKKLAAASEKGSKDQKTHLEAVTKLTKQYQDAVDDLNTSLETSLEDLQNWYENSVAKIQSDLDKSLSGGLGLDAMEEEWSLVNGWAEKYYDNVERAIELESYTNDLEDAANAIGLSAENQAKLNDFREQEIAALKAKSRLTKYDIDESRARLEIMKQEMALEDQRANKSKMRLRRDNQGNYNYQYVGDQDAEDQAEKGLLTAKKEWYQIVKKQWKDTTDYTIELSKRATELQNEYQQAVYDKDVKRQEELKALIEQNQKELQWAYSEAEKNKRDLYSGTAQYFSHVNDAEILPSADTTVRKLLDKWAKSDDKNSFTGGITKAIEELDKVAEDFCNKQIELMKKAGVQWGKLRDQGIDPTKESLDDFVDSEDELKESLEKVNDELAEQAKNLKTAEDAYNKFKETAVAAIKAANDELEKLAKTEIDAGKNLNNTIKSDSSSSSDSSNTNTSSDTSSSDSGSVDNGDDGGSKEPVKSHGYRVYTDPSGVAGKYYATDLQGHLIGNLKFVDLDTIINWLIQHGYHKSDGTWNVSKDVKEFKSGGYTGEWNKGSEESNGRLAFLHQKELVLNESDTSNLLKAVDSIRELASKNGSIDVNSIAAGLIQTGAIQAKMLAQVGQGLLSAMSSIVTNNSQSYSNNMTVNADFSGVRSADAIYQALRELESYGSQQAYSNAPFSNKSY